MNIWGVWHRGILTLQVLVAFLFPNWDGAKYFCSAVRIKTSLTEGTFFVCVINMHFTLVTWSYQKAGISHLSHLLFKWSIHLFKSRPFSPSSLLLWSFRFPGGPVIPLLCIIIYLGLASFTAILSSLLGSPNGIENPVVLQAPSLTWSRSHSSDCSSMRFILYAWQQKVSRVPDASFLGLYPDSKRDRWQWHTLMQKVTCHSCGTRESETARRIRRISSAIS